LLYKDIKKILELPNIEFKGVLEEEKSIVTNFDTFIQIKKILNLEFNHLEEFKKDDGFIQNDYKTIINILAYETKDSTKKDELEKLNISDKKIEKLLKISIRGHLSFSLGVVDKICNYMLNGYIPHESRQKIEDEYDVKIEDLPTPKDLKAEEKATFMFSVFKNELLRYSLKDKSIIKGNFLKIGNSPVIREPKNKETEFFKKQIKGLYNSWLKTDDVEELKEIMSDKAIQKELNLKLEKVSTLSSQVEKVTHLCDSVSEIIKTKYNVNAIFTMEKMNSIQTKKLRNILIQKNIVKEDVELTSNLTKTIFITLSESGYIPSSRADGQKKLIDLVKLKVDCLGTVTDEITVEIRKPLK
jgi:hypothetical protein